MKIFKFLTLSTIHAVPDDRTYTDNFAFMNDVKWMYKWNEASSTRVLDEIRTGSDKFISLHFKDNEEATKYGDKLDQMFTKTQENMMKASARCRSRANRQVYTSRRRREAEERGVWALPEAGFKTDSYQLFFTYARWIRNELYLSCPKMDSGKRMLKRMDRFRLLTVYKYCDLVDNTIDLCQYSPYAENGEKMEHPRKWMNEKFGKNFEPTFQGYSCGEQSQGETHLSMECPDQYHIEIKAANHGRWSMSTCTNNGAQVPSGKCVDNVVLTDVAQAECGGKQTCSYHGTSSEDKCPGVSKYTNIKWFCQAD